MAHVTHEPMSPWSPTGTSSLLRSIAAGSAAIVVAAGATAAIFFFGREAPRAWFFGCFFGAFVAVACVLAMPFDESRAAGVSVELGVVPAPAGSPRAASASAKTTAASPIVLRLLRLIC